MDEYFLHYIWKHQKFTSNHLKLKDDQTLLVFQQGYHNQDSGPDFEEARIKIGAIEWVGSIEIHIKSSDWINHQHSSNTAYHNVVLHVVWEHDQEIVVNGDVLPTLELKNIVNPELVLKYKNYLSSKSTFICETQISAAPKITYHTMLSRVMVERLEEKAEKVLQSLRENKNNWEETTYKTLAQNFGFSTNKTAFEKLAQRLPFEILKKHLHDELKTQALVFGQAGFLEDPQDDYQSRLKQEYEFLKTKFDLHAPLSRSEWKFGKMRPANFPSVRLAQFASVLLNNPNLFSKVVSITKPKNLIEELSFEYHAYWKTHYDFGKKKKLLAKKPGSSTLDGILINTITPILAAYSKHVDDQKYIDNALAILESLKSETNRYTKDWIKLGLKPSSAFESQAQIQLIKNYCAKRRCLACNIGVYLLGQ